MAVRKSKEDTFSFKGDIDEWMIKGEKAHQNGRFSNVKNNKLLNQLTADYKKLTVVGVIIVTLIPEGDNINIIAKSSTNADNIFALFTSPNQKILDQFKNSF